MNEIASYCKLIISEKYLPFFSDCDLRQIDEYKKLDNIPNLYFIPSAEDADIHIVLSKKSNYSSVKFQKNADFFYHIENRTLPNNWEKDYYKVQNESKDEIVVIRWNPRKQRMNEELLNSIVYIFSDFRNNTVKNHIEVNENKSWKYHLVQEGEDLYNISKEQNVTMHALMEQNKLSSSLLYIGQILEIPEYQSDSDRLDFDNTYQLQEGDTLASIAKDQGFTQDELIRFNGFKTNLLNVGTIIKFPK